MRIRALELDLFGPHLHTVGSDLKDGLVVIYGPNEAGKSSLLAALRGILFGRAIGEEPDLGAQTGSRGKLTFQSDAGVVAVERPLGAKKPPKLILPDGSGAQGDAALKQYVPALNVVDESIFRAIFTFQLAELNDLSREGDLSSQIYAAGLVGQISPLGIEQQLFARSREIFNPNSRARKQPLNECLREIKQVMKDIAAATDKPEDYLRAQADVEALQARLEELAKLQDNLTQTVANLAKGMELLPIHRELIAAREALQTMPPLPETDPYDLNKIAQSREQLARLKQDLQDVAQTEADCTAKGLDNDSLLQRLAAGWSRAVLEGLRQDEQLAVKAKREAADWRGHEQALQRLRDRLTDSERQLLRATAALQPLGLAVETASAVLADAATELVAKEERLQADDERLRRLERICTEAKELGQRAEPLRQGHNASGVGKWRVVIGVVLLVGAALATWQGVYAVAVLTGLVGLWSVFNLEQRLFARSNAGTGAVESSSARLQELEAEAKQLQATLCSLELATHPFEMTQVDWQTCHEALRQQGRLAADNQRHHRDRQLAWQALLAAQADCDERTEAVGAEERRRQSTWDAFVALCNEIGAPLLETPEALPVELDRILQWRAGADELTRLRARLAEKRQRIANGLTGLQVTCDQMQQRVDGQAGADNSTVSAQTAAAEAPAADNTSVQLDTSVSVAWLETTLSDLERTLAQLAAQAETVMTGIQAKRAEHAKVLQRMERNQHLLAGMCGSLESYQARAAVLDTQTQAGLEAELALQRQALRSAQAELSQGREQLGAATSRLATWSSKETTKQQWALAEAKTMRTELASKWAVSTLAQALVREARERFESERQPAVLATAGQLLADWTGGRYVRLQARADAGGNPQLLCLDTAGEAWEPKRLSRGTREQIYLCLRFAMIADYRDKGAILPVVLDDPMVNFDAQRLMRALQFIATQAADSQTIYLTCQGHVAQAAQQLGAQVLTFAGHQDKQLVDWEDSNGAD